MCKMLRNKINNSQIKIQYLKVKWKVPPNLAKMVEIKSLINKI